MVDKKYCISSFLALRFVEKMDVDFSSKLKYRYPPIPNNYNRVYVETAKDIDTSLKKQLNDIKDSYKKIGLLLSGGMDSSILASYLPGIDAYTFRFSGGKLYYEELQRAEFFANYNHMNLHYVDIDWDTVVDSIEPLMLSKGGPVHSIESQIYKSAIQAINDGIDIMVIGDASDYVFGGMDKLLSEDWTFDDFYRRYIYIDPFEVLKEPMDMSYVLEKYRKNGSVDVVSVLEELAAQESYGSYNNAFVTAGLQYYDPYEILKMANPLDINRIRNGESKYLIRELFKIRYPSVVVPEKIPMPRPVDEYFKKWNGPKRNEFRDDIIISNYSGNQKWLLWCLEEFLNMIDRIEK